jgi:hypothetical protein
VGWCGEGQTAGCRRAGLVLSVRDKGRGGRKCWRLLSRRRGRSRPAARMFLSSTLDCERANAIFDMRVRQRAKERCEARRRAKEKTSQLIVSDMCAERGDEKGIKERGTLTKRRLVCCTPGRHLETWMAA